MLSIIMGIVVGAVLAFALQLYRLKKEMNEKVKYPEYVKNAEDWLFKDYTSNYNYSLTSTKGIKIREDKDGNAIIESQSKLTGISITQ